MKKRVKVVAAVIENSEKELLCALRSNDMSLPNVWEFPGGKVENGEDFGTALEREIKEELHCSIRAGELLHTHVHEYEKAIVELNCLSAVIEKGEPHASEHAKLLWLPKENLTSLQWAPADIPAVDFLTTKVSR
ncbi:(deoxy)nucleoside triphosphate pyrophosphohydrolase [Alkalicoccus luteus]|uniref:8-oxo-dGTP diphosphatase n=1 Tax=Alkalicoccus luteus TaxID=1237094 RepID=A0A969PL83_9BACI|nr:(deoxy)nucleoside triphosphate pyrophosphohydrolase [Alkalicoccus luteus]NJP36222.1 (deoxy)nucleoside triphosphate pyrophosphohydrolase [Alkalicoccus luteus]